MSTSKAKSKLPPFDPDSLALPCTGVESHAHLNGKYFAEDRDEALARAKKVGIARIGQVFMGAELWEAGRHMFDAHPEVFFIVGVHPTDAQKMDDAQINGIRAAVKQDARIKAIGETGLDYYWKECPPEVQKDAFRRQLHLAKELNMPVVIHCRDAVEDTFEILTNEGFKDYDLLWHCFGGDTSFAQRILEMGWHLSVPGTVTFPANKAMREALKSIPLERMMLETDCPFLTPMPYRGKRNEPAYLALSVRVMAEEMGMEATELWTKTGETASKFFRLPALS